MAQPDAKPRSGRAIGRPKRPARPSRGTGSRAARRATAAADDHATDSGAYCYERGNGAWIEYAVNREHIGVPVDSITITDDGLVEFRMTVDDTPAVYLFDPAASTWKTGVSPQNTK